MEMEKKSYSAPRLTVHGTIEKVTQSINYRKLYDAVYTGGWACDPTGGIYGCDTFGVTWGKDNPVDQAAS